MKWLKKIWSGASVVVKVLIVVGAVLLFLVGYAFLKEWDIGGWISRLFKGGPTGKDKIKVANTIPDERVDATGAPIPQGEPDEKGYTQWVVHEAEVSSNPFRDKGKLRVTSTVTEETPDGPVEKTVSKEIDLPTGVKDKDVVKVVEVKPEVFVVEVQDTSKVSASDLLDELP